MNHDAQDRSNTEAGHLFGHPQSSLASMLVPLRIELQTTERGFALHMTPQRGLDALRVLADWCPAERPITLVGGRLPLTDVDAAEHSAVLLGDDAFALPDLRIAREMAYAVRVDGPVEPRDALAIDRAVRRGDDPLSADLRAMSAVVDTGHGSLLVASRCEESLHRVVADAMRSYLEAFGAQLDGPVSAPEPELIAGLLGVSGALTVRPIETEFFRSFVDIGVSSFTGETVGPANLSLIYDVITKTWHSD